MLYRLHTLKKGHVAGPVRQDMGIVRPRLFYDVVCVHNLPAKGRITAHNDSVEYAYLQVDAENPERVNNCLGAKDAIQLINVSNDVTVQCHH